MAKIPNHILETLICSECSCYLSFGPIRLKMEGGAVCGRCLLPDNSFVSDTPYENLATMMYFPCRYKKYGCQHQDKFGKIKTHEDDCEFKEYRCPVVTDGSCQWLGSVKQILQHVENNHNDKVLPHPCTVPHTFTKNQTNVYITLNDTFLFLVHVETSILSRTIRHWVKLIGSNEDANNFEFNLNMESLNNTKLVKTKDVLSFDSLDSDENSLVTSVTGLQEIFCNLDSLKFLVTINTKTDVIQCFDCRCFINTFVYQSGNIYKCEDCSQVDLVVCDSCGHEDDKNKMRKHKIYFCGSHTSCPYCTLSSTGALSDHIMYKHPKYYHKTTTFATNISNSSSVESTCFNKCNKMNHQMHVLQHKEFDQFLFEIYRTGQSKDVIIFNLYNYFDNEYLNEYDCHLQILGKDTDYKFEGFMDRENELDHDWTLTINYSEDFDPVHEIEIKITFQKRDLYKHPKLAALNQS